MTDHFADRITSAAKSKNTPAIVGIDPVYTKLPPQLRRNDTPDLAQTVDALFEFCLRTLRVVAPLVPAVKFNIAFFERYYWEGVENYYALIEEAAALDVAVIGDVKRGDIGSTAEAYAAAHLRNPDFSDMATTIAPDAITVNGFAGLDGIRPFADAATDTGRGIFVWVRASNPSAAPLQDFTDAHGKRFFDVLAEQVATLASEPQQLGASQLSNVGMVVGGTAAEQARNLRQQYPHIMFLVPGYGAQGADAADCLAFCRDDGSGALISASRSIIYAFDNPKYAQQFGDNWEKCIEAACLDMKQDLASAM